MKRTRIKIQQAPAKSARGASDTLCKRLAEEYPAQFARWLFGAGGKVKVEKTEMSREPIRADSVIFSRGERETLHAAFQQFFREHSEHWVERFDYKEAGLQLLLQAFLQRVINGGGRIESECGLGRKRTDLLIIWNYPGGTRAGRIGIEDCAR